jgi:glycosyltransferase involved in cell wall biosynthesis
MNAPEIPTILFLISSEGYYGAENMLVTLACNLSRLSSCCVIGVFSDHRFQHSEVGEQARRQGLTVETVSCEGRADWQTVRQIRKLMVKHNANILHPHGYKADLYAYAAVWPNRAALVATCHNWPSKLLSMRVYAALDKLVLRRFHKVVGVSDFASDIVRRWGTAPNKVSTIPNGVDIERFERAAPTLRNEIASENCSLVGFVGRLVPDKGGAVLLRAAQQVLSIHRDTKFVLIGEGPARKEWEALATHLGVDGRVVFTGVREDMPEVYASLDMLVLPSVNESMPMCLLEAMAAGIPVIATRVGSIPKLILQEQTGLLLEAGDVKGLAAAILRLLRNPHQARRLRENARVHAAQCFSARAMAESYMDVYEQVLIGRRSGIPKQAALEAS